MSNPLPARLQLGPATLRVPDAGRAAAFYVDKVGLQRLEQTPSRLTLGAGGEAVLILEIQPGLAPRRKDETGLYHVAILLPDRPALGGTIARLAANDVRLGAADHLVSEAIYLWDDDNNGIEIYRDRPRGEWNWREGTVQMANRPLDFPGLLSQQDVAALAANPMPRGTRIGHVHLQVDDIAKASAFYCDLVGFEKTATMPGALFVSAGGYHHHLAFNVWDSRKGSLPSPDTAGLVSLELDLPEERDVAALAARLEAANVAVAKTGARELRFTDPWRADVIVRVTG